MLGSIPHQKFCFYHLPTRGWVGIKLGDAWYVSNVSIIFDFSMLLYYLFWMLMGFILHFYIIFGTTLLMQGPVEIAVFCLFQCFTEKEYQTESKRNKTFRRVIFGTNVIQRNWTSRNKRGVHEVVGAPTPLGAPSCFVVASWRSRLQLQVFWFACGPRKIITKVSFCLDSVWYSFSTKL